MKAQLNNYRQAPRKVRLITTLVQGKSAAHAQAILANMIKRGALPIKKLLDSAVANAGVPATSLLLSQQQLTRGLLSSDGCRVRWDERFRSTSIPPR
jgi:hypothetical protein